MLPVEFRILQRINHVETADPCDDESGQQDRQHGELSRNRKVCPHRSDPQRNAEYDVAPGGEAFGQAVSQQHGQCKGGEAECQEIDPCGRGGEQQGIDNNKPQGVPC